MKIKRICWKILILIAGVFLVTPVLSVQAIQVIQGILVYERSVEEKCMSMTLEEKIAQMFLITPEALSGVSPVTETGDIIEASFQQYPVGGLIYFRENLISREQTVRLLDRMQKISKQRTGLPIFLAVDEEGGTVSRLYGGGITDIPYIGDMYTIGASGDSEQAYTAGNTIGTYLKSLGFNVDFAPVADVFSNLSNTVIGNRSFGNDAELVSEMVGMAVKGLQNTGIRATLKHFPGHGDTAEDSHSGYASSYKSLEQLEECEFLPFRTGIEAGADFIMAGHISLPNVLGDQTPASLSYKMLTEILRDKMGFDGIIITDALNMGAITNYYSSGEAAVSAVKAGADMLLMPENFEDAYNGMINAVYDGRISEERINESVIRILRVKKKIANLREEE